MITPHPRSPCPEVAGEGEPPRLGVPTDDRGLSRNYTVDLKLLGLSGETAGARVLDLGCGAGRHELAAVGLPVAVVACDVSLGDLRDGRFFVGEASREQASCGAVEWVQADGLRLPFRCGQFDALLCSETLEHVDDDVAMLRELRRVAKRGSRLAVSVPAYWPELVLWLLSWRITHTAGGHVRVYREPDLLAKLRATGWMPYAKRRRHSLETIYWLLGAVSGGGDPPRWPARTWRRYVTTPENADSDVLRRIERVLDPVLMKSIVVYARAV